MQYSAATELPTFLYDLLTRDNKTQTADYTVTGLIKPVQMRALELRHADKVVSDPYDNLWKLFGKLLHGKLDSDDDWSVLAEHTITAEIEGKTVSGTIDRWEPRDGGILWDFKVTSVWRCIAGISFEWEAQLNLYRWLLLKDGHAVSQAKICMILRDWSAAKAKQDKSYPQRGIVIRNVTLWSNDECENYAAERVKAHELAKAQRDAELPPCSDQERWMTQPTFAVKKSKSASRAVSGGLFSPQDYWGNIDDARKAADELAAQIGGVVEQREGHYRRCEDYCNMADFCHTWQAAARSKKQQ